MPWKDSAQSKESITADCVDKKNREWMQMIGDGLHRSGFYCGKTLIVYLCMSGSVYAWVCVQACEHATAYHGCQKTTCGSGLSASTLWVPT